MNVFMNIGNWFIKWRAVIVIAIIVIIVQLPILIFRIEIVSNLDKTMVMYLSSTSAQVIAALFGLTITGYIFFHGRLLSTKKDDTLFDAIEALRSRYYVWLIGLSAICLLAILVNLCNFLVNRAEGIVFEWKRQFLIAEGSYLTVLSIIFIALFILNVVNPKQIENISKRELNRLNKGKRIISNDNDLATFLRVYNEIETRIAQLAEQYTLKNTLQFSMMKNLEAAARNEKISHHLYNNINELRHYRNYLVHGNEMQVSVDMLKSAEVILNELKGVMEN